MHSTNIPSLASEPKADAMGSHEALDAHPFATEFYLQQFASDPDSSVMRQQRSSWFSPMFTPVTNAASELSKKVASLRRALVRMMP